MLTLSLVSGAHAAKVAVLVESPAPGPLGESQRKLFESLYVSRGYKVVIVSAREAVSPEALKRALGRLGAVSDLHLSLPGPQTPAAGHLRETLADFQKRNPRAVTVITSSSPDFPARDLSELPRLIAFNAGPERAPAPLCGPSGNREVFPMWMDRGLRAGRSAGESFLAAHAAQLESCSAVETLPVPRHHLRAPENSAQAAVLDWCAKNSQPSPPATEAGTPSPPLERFVESPYKRELEAARATLASKCGTAREKKDEENFRQHRRQVLAKMARLYRQAGNAPPAPALENLIRDAEARIELARAATPAAGTENSAPRENVLRDLERHLAALKSPGAADFVRSQTDLRTREIESCLSAVPLSERCLEAARELEWNYSALMGGPSADPPAPAPAPMEECRGSDPSAVRSCALSGFDGTDLEQALQPFPSLVQACDEVRARSGELEQNLACIRRFSALAAVRNRAHLNQMLDLFDEPLASPAPGAPAPEGGRR